MKKRTAATTSKPSSPPVATGDSLEGAYVPLAAVYGLDLRTPGEPWERRREQGMALRVKTPREAHAGWTPPDNRPNPVETLLATNAGRQEHLIPLRMGRMTASPFAFLRGAASVMAWDLAQTPNTGLPVIIDGDAHINYFGLYGTPQMEVVVDINDFDEVTIGPWEWDLKRLTASVNVAGRENGLNRKERRAAVMKCVAAYRENAERLANMGFMDVWYRHAFADRIAPTS